MDTLLVILLIAIFFVLLAVVALLNRQQLEVRSVAERIRNLEQNQSFAGQNLSLLQSELSQARQGLTALQTQAQTRSTLDQQMAESVRRLETIIAGTYSKGAAGENVLDLVFSQLPIEWQVRDFRLGNHTVEFGLRLPDNRVLPIDSKWPATGLVERLAGSQDPSERRKLKDQIGVAVLAKAREVTKYLDPNLTVNFGVACVPDAVYDLSSEVQVACFEMNVVVVSYSMFVPYLLLVFQTMLKASNNIDLEKLDAHLRVAETSVSSLQQELEGRFARAITMLGNSKIDMSAHLSRIQATLTNVHINAGTHPELPENLPFLEAGDELSADQLPL